MSIARLLLAGALPALFMTGAMALDIALPTANQALYGTRPSSFYMYVDRDFEGRKTQEWEGGQYGFVRNPLRVGGRLVFTRFHEGLDIAPVRRDANGEPLDPVGAIADGRVVHASTNPRLSNYGNYVVVEHEFDGSPVYSLYAHLNHVSVAPGDRVRKGQQLGILGYTGDGINKRRAHLHLEVALLLNDAFPDWHRRHFPSTNHHGIYNGMNLVGVDAARLFLDHRRNPRLTFRDFMRGEPVFFKVRVPASRNFQLPRRYPWMVERSLPSPGSWIVSFTASGVPVTLEAAPEHVARPVLMWVKPSPIPYQHVTRNLLTGSPGAPKLTPNGERFLSLLSWPDGAGAASP